MSSYPGDREIRDLRERLGLWKDRVKPAALFSAWSLGENLLVIFLTLLAAF